ncbi:hypothetical protein ACQKEN_03885 [Pseudomonas sp. NPDC078416]
MPANAALQATLPVQTHRVRQQAGAYGFAFIPDSGFDADPL